ncbi:hypothetical protein HTG_18925 [Natrinema mahii]|nr:hypothetical protein HTG_18925 [Natrinema mahii]
MSSAVHNNQDSDKEQFSSNIPLELKISLIIIPFILSIFGYFFTYPASQENTRVFLRTLVQAESSVIAIVFSVIFLGVQVISSRYTTRMGRLFFRDHLIQFTIFILSLTIAVDLYLLYILPETIGQMFVGYLYFSVGLSLVAFYSLYLSIRRMIESSTPEGVIHTSKNLINYSDFIDFCKGKGLSGPPTRGLFSFTTASLSENERVTSKIAFEQYIELVEGLFREFLGNEEEQELTNSEIRTGFSPIFKQQLANIYLISESKSNKYVQRETAACYRQLTQLFHSEIEILDIASEGFSELVSEADNSNLVFDQYFGLILILSENEQFTGSEIFIREITSIVSEEGSKEIAPDRIIDSTIRYAPAIYQRSLSNSMKEIIVFNNKPTTERYSGRKDRDPPADAAIELERLLLKLTLSEHSRSQGIRRLSGFDSLLECWKEMCIIAFRLSSKDHAQYLSQLLVEIALVDLDNRRSGLSISEWGEVIGEIQFYGNYDIVSAAFKEAHTHLESQRTSGSYQSVSEESGELELIDIEVDTSYNKLENLMTNLQSEADNCHEILVWDNNDVKSIRKVIQNHPGLVGLKASQNYLSSARIRGQYRLYDQAYSERRLIGKDSLLMRNSDGHMIFIKLVQSIEVEDFENIDKVRSEVYNQAIHHYPAVYGPHPFRTLLVTPNVTDEIIERFENDGIEIKTIKSKELFSNGLVRQTTLDEFVQKSPETYSSDLI